MARRQHRDINPMTWMTAELQSAMDSTVDFTDIGRAISAAVAVRYWTRWGAAKVLDEFEFGRFSYLFDSTPASMTDPKEPANRVLAAWGVPPCRVRSHDPRAVYNAHTRVVGRRYVPS